ncbi:Primosomal protein DnaI [Mycoplasmopsis californica]|uniref:ATP-binding protein n=1 Tax=Mycoplasmopsis equigenitalium TaxID=114883 RepID=A0ABY5J0N6_9BACT|nr:ATP-binding protein [Mycoplasmopsis equigenitalium]UUD36823.1 ATP-binding protein [Mycoplasmopsis equigenitalium]VEU69880.1 Primosomal protein DnaI [Mycoplasmopsis californica]
MDKFQKKIIKHKEVIRQLKNVQATKFEVLEYWPIIENFYNIIVNKTYAGSGRVPLLQRDPKFNRIYLTIDFKNDSNGRKQRIIDNTSWDILNILADNDEYRNADIRKIIKATLPWQKENWNHINKFMTEGLKNKPVKDLYLYGLYGSGKTYLAHAIANEFALKNKNILIAQTLTLFQYINANQDDKFELLKRLSEVDLLVLDDLGREPANPYTSWFLLDFIYNIIVTRQLNNRPIIITTNYKQDDFKDLIENFEKKADSFGVYARIKDYLDNNTINIETDGINIRSTKK